MYVRHAQTGILKGKHIVPEPLEFYLAVVIADVEYKILSRLYGKYRITSRCVGVELRIFKMYIVHEYVQTVIQGWLGSLSLIIDSLTFFNSSGELSLFNFLPFFSFSYRPLPPSIHSSPTEIRPYRFSSRLYTARQLLLWGPAHMLRRS